MTNKHEGLFGELVMFLLKLLFALQEEEEEEEINFSQVPLSEPTSVRYLYQNQITKECQLLALFQPLSRMSLPPLTPGTPL